jgi:sugar phosphate isomerase/epimerase
VYTPDQREDDVSPDERERLRRKSRESGVLFSVHAPCSADPTTPGGIDAIRRSIRFAGDVGARVVNLHLFPEHGARPFTESFRPLLELAAAVGVRLSLENTPQCSTDDFNATFGVLSDVPEATGRVGMCLDMGHANLFLGTRKNYLRFVDLLGEHVPIIHCSVRASVVDDDHLN